MAVSRRFFIMGGIMAAAAFGAGAKGIAGNAEGQNTPLFPAHAPMGKGRGINPGRVTWTHNPEVVKWDGVDYWWKPENFDKIRILEMIRKGIMTLANEPTPYEAWQALFAWRRKQNGQTGSYAPGEKIAIKTNMNGAGEYNDDPHGHVGSHYANAVLLQALLLSLVEDGKVDPTYITIFDTCRIFPVYMQKMCSEGSLKGVSFRYRDIGGSKDAVADPNAPINWAGPIEGYKTFFPKCLTEATYLINLANLKGHSWGMTLGAKNHFGSFINRERRLTPSAAGLHDNIINAKMGDYSVLADLNARQEINEKTILWILDALITAPSETGNITPSKARFKMAPFNDYYACSLFFSQDPLAIDSVGADFLTSEPVMREYNSELAHKSQMENYLHEAALLDNPPSGTAYSNGHGKNPGPLGVHEHWNNPREKLYSRNRGASEGIELVRVM